MKVALVHVLLGLGVLCAWLAVLAAARSRRGLDRIHALAFANVAGFGLVLAAALLHEGLSARTVKLLFLYFAQLLIGGAVAHALARALAVRDGRNLS